MLDERSTWREHVTWDLVRRVVLALVALAAFVIIGSFIQTKVQRRAWDDVVGDGGTLYNLRYSPDFQLIGTATLGEGVYLWNARDRTLLNKLGEQGIATQLEFSPEHPEFAWSYADYAFFYSSHYGRMVNAPIRAKSWIYSVALAPSRFAVVATGGSAVELWNSVVPDNTHHVVADYGAEATVASLTFSADSKLLAGGLSDGRVVAWRIEDTNPAEEFKTEQIFSRSVFSASEQVGGPAVVLSPDNQLIAAGRGSTIKILRVQDGEILRQLNIPGQIYRYSFSPDSTLLVVPHANPDTDTFSTQTPGNISAWRVDSGERIWSSEQVSSPIVDLQVSQDNKMITAGHFDGEVRTYKMP